MDNKIALEDIEHIYAGAPQDVYQDGVVVITGCAGFLGYYFTQYFARRAEQLGIRKVIGLDSFIRGEPEWLKSCVEESNGKLDLRKFDIANDDLTAVPDAMDATQVIHMASIASPIFYRQFPIETIDANIWGLRKLLDAYKESKRLRGLLFFSSSEIYGDPDPAKIPIDEEYRGNVACIGPRACYDEAKRFGETMCYEFSRKFGTPITIARPFNNFGPGMSLHDARAPADFARSAMAGEDIVLLSNGSPTRTFCYVTDAIIGYLKVLNHNAFEAFNIGMEEPECSIRRLAEVYVDATKEVLGKDIQLTFARSEDADYLTDNPQRRRPSIAKARSLLDYEPSISVEEGVRRYLAFLQAEGTA